MVKIPILWAAVRQSACGQRVGANGRQSGVTYTWWATLDDYTGAANVSQLQFIADSRVGRQCGRKQEGMQRKEENGVAVGGCSSGCRAGAGG